MDEREVRELLERLLAAMDPAQEFEARHEDFTVEFPQSGERMNRDGLRSMQEAYPGGAPIIRLHRLVGAGDVWFRETVIRYEDGSVWHGVAIIEFRDGKIWKETRYFAVRGAEMAGPVGRANGRNLRQRERRPANAGDGS